MCQSIQEKLIKQDTLHGFRNWAARETENGTITRYTQIMNKGIRKKHEKLHNSSE
jgi:hypothetical protein